MAQSYYTVLLREADGCWYDVFGSRSKAEAQGELDYLRDDGAKRKDLQIIVTDGTAKALIAKLRELNSAS